MLICCGINPSNACPDHLDPTMKRVEAFSKEHGYDGYVMINLYPLKETNVDHLPPTKDKSMTDINSAMIKKLLENMDEKIDIWAAWGTAISKRDYLKECLKEIFALTQEYPCNWYHIGSMTKDGHPRHPLYLDEGTEKVDNTAYIWYNVYIKYRRCFYDRTTTEIGIKSIYGNI